MHPPLRHLAASHCEESWVTQNMRKKLEAVGGLSCPINRQH